MAISFAFMPFTHFYPRPPRGGRLYHALHDSTNKKISIHALREEGDDFSIQTTSYGALFLSTPSARRATLPAVPEVQAGVISIHALREEGDIRTGTQSIKP